MKKTTKIIIGAIVLIGAGIAAFFLFSKNKLTGSTSPLLGSTAGSNTAELKALSDKITAVENDLKNKTIPPQTVNNVTGATIHTGEGSPASTLGVDKDLYFDSTNGYTFIKINGIWQYAATGIYDGWSDEYSDETANFLRPASVGAVAQVRDLAYKLADMAKQPPFVVIDVLDHVATQYQFEIRIPITEFPVWGSEYVLPIYKFINADCQPYIFLGDATQYFYSDQLTAGSMIYPKFENNAWTYIKI